MRRHFLDSPRMTIVRANKGTKMGTDWISAGNRLPRVGDWQFPDKMKPDFGMRTAGCVPVLLTNGETAWGEYFEASDDHGRTVTEMGWSLWDPDHDETTSEVTHWFELPPPPRG